MKAYTDLEQSKKLAEILPIESADMCFNISRMTPLMTPYSKFDEFFNISPTPDFLIPCWSLAALFDLLPNNEHIETSISRGSWKIDPVEYVPNTWWCEYEDTENQTEFNVSADNPVDACYEMIIKLHEQKLL